MMERTGGGSDPEVVLLGTGYPLSDPSRAGPATAIRAEDRWLVVDAGRSCVQRLAEAGASLRDLDAVLVTHHHSDHLVDLGSLAISRWVDGGDGPLVVVAPEGPAVEFARHALDAYDERMFVDQGAFARSERPAIDARAFHAPDERHEVFADGPWRVSSREVEHGAAQPAVAYRIETPRITVCVSGDTRVCAGVEDLAQRADVLVHEAVHAEPLEAAGFGALLASNADAAAVGALARRCQVRLLALTHLIPPPSNENDEHAFEADVRRGGYTGPLIVGRDLARCAPGTLPLLGD